MKKSLACALTMIFLLALAALASLQATAPASFQAGHEGQAAVPGNIDTRDTRLLDTARDQPRPRRLRVRRRPLGRGE